MIIYNQVLSSGIDLKIIALINKTEYRGKIFIQCLSCTLHILDNLMDSPYILVDFPGGSDGKASTYNAGIGEGNGTPLQYSCLENPMDGGAW